MAEPPLTARELLTEVIELAQPERGCIITLVERVADLPNWEADFAAPTEGFAARFLNARTQLRTTWPEIDWSDEVAKPGSDRRSVHYRNP